MHSFLENVQKSSIDNGKYFAVRENHVQTIVDRPRLELRCFSATLIQIARSSSTYLSLIARLFGGSDKRVRQACRTLFDTRSSTSILPPSLQEETLPRLLFTFLQEISSSLKPIVCRSSQFPQIHILKVIVSYFSSFLQVHQNSFPMFADKNPRHGPNYMNDPDIDRLCI